MRRGEDKRSIHVVSKRLLRTPAVVFAAILCSGIDGAVPSGEVRDGCTNADGYSGGITATSTPPYYSGAFTPVLCPPEEATGFVPTGCIAKDGYSGTVTAQQSAPGYTSTLTAVGCPEGSEAPDISANPPRGTVPAGCVPLPGYSGTVVATSIDPFFTDTLAAVNCPMGQLPDRAFAIATTGTVPGQNGTDGTSGCTVLAGWAGRVSATSSPPFFNRSQLAGITSLPPRPSH